MRKVMMMIIQVLIFVGAWFIMTPDTLEDNTHLFGLFGDVEITKGNTDWVMLAAMLVSIINILIWWPKAQGVVNTSSESATPVVAEGTKSAEAKEIDRDPKTPDLS